MQQVKLQTDKKENYRVREAFRSFRSNIEFSGQDIRLIAITSCTPNEGKTSCAMELARAFAKSGKHTVLVDADMRKSVMVGRYKTGSVRLGLTHYLVGQEYLDDVLCRSNESNLDLIFSGPVPPNPSELLGSELFADMLSTLRERYDYVVVDTPPLGSVIDAAVVAKRCDGTVIIIENNAVSYRFAQQVKEQLDVAGARILGVVLNKVDLDGNGYYGHKYYGKYYGNYGEDNQSTGSYRRITNYSGTDSRKKTAHTSDGHRRPTSPSERTGGVSQDTRSNTGSLGNMFGELRNADIDETEYLDIGDGQ